MSASPPAKRPRSSDDPLSQQEQVEEKTLGTGEVELNAKSATEGDLILVGSDGRGVRVWSFDLKSHSSVFRLMLDTTLSTSTTIHLDSITSDDLFLIAHAMRHRAFPRNHPIPANPDPLFDFCNRYQLNQARTMLLERIANDPYSNPDLFDLFVRASEHNDLLAALIILERCTYDAEGRTARLAFIPQAMHMVDVARLSPVWVQAMNDANPDPMFDWNVGEDEDEEYAQDQQWDFFIVRFLAAVRRYSVSNDYA